MSGLFYLSGKTALVTGGNGGIGLGIARGLAGAGANIVVAARNQAKTEEAVREISALGVGAIGVTMDVMDEDSVSGGVSAAVSEFGGINILVNNAGIGIRKPPQDYSLEEWRQVVGINLDGTFLCSREVYPHMKNAGAGKIINIGSMTSVFGSDWVAAYSASKGGVVQLTKSLAVRGPRTTYRSTRFCPAGYTRISPSRFAVSSLNATSTSGPAFLMVAGANLTKWVERRSSWRARPQTMSPESRCPWTAATRRSDEL